MLNLPRSRSGRLHSNSNTAVTPAGVAPLGDARVPRKANAARVAGPAPGRTPASSTRGGGKENQQGLKGSYGKGTGGGIMDVLLGPG